MTGLNAFTSPIGFSLVAVTFQCIGTLLLALMMARLGRIFTWRYGARWASAWIAMFLALASMRIYLSSGRELWLIPYLIGQWAFLAFLYAGCRELMGRQHLHLRPLAYALPLLIAVAALLTHFSRSLFDLLAYEAVLVAVGTAISFRALGGVELRTAGWQTMRLALALMTLIYLTYAPLYALYAQGVTISWLPYSSLADLLFFVFLGFAMILIAAEDANRGLNDAVTALETVRSQLELKMRTDPLTEALNRHAFQAAVAGSVRGTVCMIDIDHLKEINDADGHPVGDAVIRSAANAVRGRIRADDLLFRWGGDEFLVILPNSTSAAVNNRLAPLAEGVPTLNGAITFHLSWGIAEFGDAVTLEDAIRVADHQMYERRVATRKVG
ncbi:MAG: GGDEF domain-containing protein [Acidobacteriota bacterium]